MDACHMDSQDALDQHYERELQAKHAGPTHCSSLSLIFNSYSRGKSSFLAQVCIVTAWSGNTVCLSWAHKFGGCRWSAVTHKFTDHITLAN